MISHSTQRKIISWKLKNVHFKEIKERICIQGRILKEEKRCVEI